MIRIGFFSAVICSVLARSVKYRADGTCGVQNVFIECPGTTCVQRHFDEDNCMTCKCNPIENRMGDMVLSTEAISFIIDGNRDGIAKGADPTRPLWNTIQEGNRFVIPYSLSSDLTTPYVDAINAAIAEIQAKCCFTFRQRTTEPDYMFFFRGSGCFANVGRWSGENRISIGEGCTTKGITIHEIMHNLGFFHEHQRPDRDSYVRVITGNISPDAQDQYQIINNIDSKGSPYDYGSIMHYGAYAFAVDRSNPTMTFANGSTLAGIQISEMSVYDAQQIATLYKCQAPFDNTTAAVTTTATSVATTVTTFATNTTSIAVDTTTVTANATTTSAGVTTTAAGANTTTAGAITTTAGTTTTIAVTATTTAGVNTTAGVTTTTASATTTIPNPDCADRDQQCSSWAGQGFCTNPKYPEVPRLCPKSCKICTQGSCFDNFGSEICSGWKDFCPFNAHVRSECKKTCGLC